MEMKLENCIPWHHLIFCEEFVSDADENEVFCSVCEERLSGYPTYKCLECSFIQHKTCVEPPELKRKYFKNDLCWNRHHVILMEEVVSRGKEKVVCMGCRKPASGPAYKCSNPYCTFHLHKSCTQIPQAIQDVAHPDHTLILLLPLVGRDCDLCGGYIAHSVDLMYGCLLCNFYIDIKCAFHFEISLDCKKHDFITSRKRIQFTCEACGKETKDFANHCSVCQVITHLKCSDFPPTMRTYLHNHMLYRTYSVRRVKNHKNIVCKICCKKVNTECGAYYCKKCEYIVHMRCARWHLDKNLATMNSEGTEFDEYDYGKHMVYLMEGLTKEKDEIALVPSEVCHDSHTQHKLILNYEDPLKSKFSHENDKRCEACMQSIIFTPFYGCEECNFFLHTRCARLPEIISRPPFRPGSFSLHSQPQYRDKLFRCDICKRLRHGFFYKYIEPNPPEIRLNLYREIDVQCCLIPESIDHESHEHSIHLLSTAFNYGIKPCNGCGYYSTEDKFFLCSDCEFYLCIECATLPLVARHQYDIHILKLTYEYTDDLEDCYCLICKKERDPKKWFYSCVLCDFATHIECIIGWNPYVRLGSSFEWEYHDHLVKVVQTIEDTTECNSCRRGFKARVSLECTQCKCNFHFDCNSDYT